MKNLNVRYKLILISIIPILTIFIISGIYLNRLYLNYLEQNNIIKFVTVFISSGNLVHEFQKERGMSAGFLSSKGLEYSDDVKKQRTKVNEVFGLLKQNSSGESNSVKILEKNFFVKLETSLTKYRNRIDKLEVTAKEQIPFFTKLISEILLNVLNGIALIDNPDVGRMLGSYYKLVLAKENSGIERATVNSVLSKKEFDSNSFEVWIRVKSIQELCIKEFIQLSPLEFKETYEKTLKKEDIKFFLEYQEKISEFKITNKIDLKPKSWWDESTKRINLLKNIEDKIAFRVKEEAEILSNQALKQIIFFAAFLFFTVAVILLSTNFLANDILNSLKDFMSKTDLVSNGNLILTEEKIFRKDEFGKLTNQINLMILKLRGMVKSISGSSSELSLISTEINSTALKSAETATELAATVEQAAAAVKSISENFSLMDSKIIHSVENINQFNQKVEKISESISDLTKNSEEITKKMNFTKSKAKEGENEIKNLISIIEEIKNTGKLVNESVGLINEISEQTNLLSLNASIEAARAGEFGSGFSIVAKNISKLSELTNQSVTKIKKLTSSSEKALNLGIYSSINTNKIITELIDFIEFTSTHIENISTEMKKQNEEAVSFKNDMAIFQNTFNSISTLSLDQKGAVNVIMETFDYNSSLAQTSSASSEELASISEQLNLKSIELKKIVGEFRV